jgi:tetratricopeptide (TPR) repeat protein
LAKHHHSDAPDVIEEFESAAERMAQWVSANRWLALGTLALMLGVTAGIGGFRAWHERREAQASDALSATRSAYLSALGAQPGSFQEPELANPEAAREIREQFVERFDAVAQEHSGTVAGTLALLELADLLDKLGRPAQTDEVWRRALASTSDNPGLRGVLEQRMAEVFEAREAWAEAAEAHARAGQLEGYPLRYWALLDAARCWAAAGDAARALELYEQVEREAPDLAVPEHLRLQHRELRATHSP